MSEAIGWVEVTEDRYNEALEVLPPALWIGSYFLVGEPTDHQSDSGAPRFPAFRCVGDRYEESTRPLTRDELRAARTAAKGAQ